MLAVLLIGIIVGVAVYVNKPPMESKWNVHIVVDGVSKSELILYMERYDENGEDIELVLDVPFKVERWTTLGWQTVNMKENIRFGIDGDVPLVEKTYSSANREEFDLYYEYLPMGMYRISRSVSARWEPANSETYYAPFVLMSWWEILLAIIFIAILVCVIWYCGDMVDKIKVKLPKWKCTTVKKPFVVGLGVAERDAVISREDVRRAGSGEGVILHLYGNSWKRGV